MSVGRITCLRVLRSRVSVQSRLVGIELDSSRIQAFRVARAVILPVFVDVVLILLAVLDSAGHVVVSGSLQIFTISTSLSQISARCSAEAEKQYGHVPFPTNAGPLVPLICM